MSQAPIAVFAYNRPDHLEQTLKALAANHGASESDLFIFCDGAKSQPDPAVKQVRQVAKSTKGFQSVQVIEAKTNKGLAQSIIDGVTDITNRFEKAIVLEDDLVTSTGFLNYMNAGLEKYAANDQVASIHGYVYPSKKELPETFFIRGADCWGWATWSRAWKLFEKDGEKLARQLKKQKLVQEFNFGGAYNYYRMLTNQVAGKNNSWAVRWHASSFLQNRLTLYPGKTLVKNIGFDGSGTHCGDLDKDLWKQELAQSIQVSDIEVKENALAKQVFAQYLTHLEPSPLRRIKRWATRLASFGRQSRG